MSGIASMVRKAAARVRAADRRQVLVACAACALAIIVLLLLSEGLLDHDIWRSADRDAFYPLGHYNTTPHMAATVAILSIWGPFSCWRCFDPLVRRYMAGCFMLFAGWMLVVIVKYAVVWDPAVELLWYCFYVPILLVPMLCVFTAFRAAGVDGRPAVVRCRRALLAINALLLVVVFTNGIHHAVFSFDATDPDWFENYEYAPLYYVVYAMAVGQFVAFFAVLFANAYRQLRGAIVTVSLVCALAVVYGLAYVLRVPFFFSGNFSLSYTWFVCVAIELCFDFGIIPAFAHYGRLFQTLPMDVKVFSLSAERGDGPIYATFQAGPVSPQGRSCVEACATGPVRLISDVTPDVVYHAQRISGGITLVTEDISAISSRRRVLEQRHAALRSSCALLEQERLMRERLREQESERALYDEVDQSISEALGRARELMCQVEGLPGDEAVFKLTIAKMLISYCKRKGGIVLARRSDCDFEREKLQLIVGELVTDLQTAGVSCGALVETGEMIPVDAVSVLYDCLYDFSIASLYCVDPVLMMYFSDYSDGAIEMRLALSTGELRNLAESEEMQELRVLLDGRDVAYRLTGEEGSLVLVVVVRKER